MSGVGSVVEAHRADLPTFSFGDEVIKSARIEVADLFSAAREVVTDSRLPTDVVDFPEVYLGADFFLAHRVYVARSQNMVYISYVGGQPFKGAQRAAPTNSTPP